MKAGKAALYGEPVDINARLRKQVKQAQGLTVIYTRACILGDGLPLVPGDQDPLIQVISTLLSHAVKYSPVGSAIVLRSQRAEDIIQVSIQDRARESFALRQPECCVSQIHRVKALVKGSHGV